MGKAGGSIVKCYFNCEGKTSGSHQNKAAKILQSCCNKQFVGKNKEDLVFLLWEDLRKIKLH